MSRSAAATAPAAPPPAAPLPAGAAPPTGPDGLSRAEVAARVARGATNAVSLRSSRSVLEIVRANVLTFFNGLLLALFVVVVTTGRWQNGLFGLVIVANSMIGMTQELRAKRILDRLAVLNAPIARVVRDGEVVTLDVADVVLDDLVVLRAGDQVPADGRLVQVESLEIDESLLTGESDPVAAVLGGPVRSGSVVVAGRGRFQATAVGAEAYATKLAADARRFTLTSSELVDGTNRILRWISVLMAVVGPVLLWSQFRSPDNMGWRDAVTGAVAGMVGMIPEGLVLLTSLAFLLATVSLAGQHTLVQELRAVEGLARVDVVCLDKTGTLTHGDVRVTDLELLEAGPGTGARQALGLIFADGAGNATAAAVALAWPDTQWAAEQRIPFDSTRKWSAATTDGHGVWVLGAPEFVSPRPTTVAQRAARARAAELAATGRRVLLLGRADHPGDVTPNPELPPDLVPVALVVLAERVREDAAETLRYFTEQGVALKVISGDSPRTVGAVAAAVGVPGADEPVDARGLPEDTAALADVVEARSVFGRVTPQQKRAMVAALQSRGHVVAMTGDGVNDTLALKDADIGIAMGNGSAAARAVAQIVLLDGRFSRLPGVVAEGRRVIANVERASNLFLVKNTYALVLALVAAVTLSAYPLAPIQLTLISTLTIGIPGAVLALAPNTRRYVPGFVRRVLRFAIPIGVLTAVAAYVGYRLTMLLDPAAGVVEGRTTATVVVLVISLWTVVVLARPISRGEALMLAGLVGAAAVVVAIPSLRHGLFLMSPDGVDLLVAGVVGAAGAAAVEVAHRVVSRHRPADG